MWIPSSGRCAMAAYVFFANPKTCPGESGSPPSRIRTATRWHSPTTLVRRRPSAHVELSAAQRAIARCAADRSSSGADAGKAELKDAVDQLIDVAPRKVRLGDE